MTPAREPMPDSLLRWLSAITVAFIAAIVLLLAVVALGATLLPVPIRQALLDVAAAFLTAAAGFVSTVLLARARLPRAEPTRAVTVMPASASTEVSGSTPTGISALTETSASTVESVLWSKAHAHIRAVLSRINWREDWLPLLATPALCALALLTLYRARYLTGSAASVPFDPWIAALFIVSAFPVAVLERHLAGMPERSLPEAPALARLCRVPLLALLGLGIASGIRGLGFEQAALVEYVVMAVTALVAFEMTLRSAVRLLLPFEPLATRRAQVASTLAGLIQLRRPNVAAFAEGVRREVGIDLTRSWALGFLRRASMPMLLALLIFTWLLTGVTALSVNERAVYEAFGQPVAVLKPGLRVHWPWPFGVLKRVELGPVHEIPIVFAEDEARTVAAPGELAASVQGPEGEPPVSADRLWDASHPSEASYLVASESRGEQNFEVINIDLRVMYRIGLSDTAARAAVYNVESPEPLIRAAAGRMLARYFARYTVLDVLGQNREAFVAGFQQELQARLSALQTGVEIMGVVVEAIHPPPQAAPAYQGVQTAAIRSVAQIAVAKADAALSSNYARQQATDLLNRTRAAAAEQLDAARTAQVLFNGDRAAHAAGGAAFLLERRLEHVNKVLPRAPLTIIDHRISPTDLPLLDLRSPGDAYAPGVDE